MKLRPLELETLALPDFVSMLAESGIFVTLFAIVGEY